VVGLISAHDDDMLNDDGNKLAERRRMKGGGLQ
jgi:hypothetical protein